MIKFEKGMKTKKIGKFNDPQGIGVATTINAEVIRADYKRNKDNKIIETRNGSKIVEIFCKIEKEITKKDGAIVKIPIFFTVNYFENKFSPTLKEINPENTPKYVRITYNTGGEDTFGEFKIVNKETDMGIKSTITIFGANITKAFKRDGEYFIKSYQDKEEKFILSKDIKLLVKGIVANFNNIEEFLQLNYNENKKELSFDVWYLESENEFDNLLPVKIKNVDKEKATKFAKIVAENRYNTFSFRANIESEAVRGEVNENKEFEFGHYKENNVSNNIIGYKYYAVVEQDENGNHKIAITPNKFEVVVDTASEDEEEDKVFPF